MRYPPKGRRGYSRTVRAYQYGLSVDQGEDDAAPLLFVQIESAEGVENLEAIAGVDGVDVLFVGPADLKLSLSHTSNAPAYEAVLDRVVAEAKVREIQAGILIRDYTEANTRFQSGFTIVALDSDLGILRKEFLRISQYSDRS
jgi:2-dehydro-3-deoxyglucarate aldolase/4-hydroxy-2-oxoheptanedioate aldolase